MVDLEQKKCTHANKEINESDWFKTAILQNCCKLQQIEARNFRFNETCRIRNTKLEII